MLKINYKIISFIVGIIITTFVFILSNNSISEEKNISKITGLINSENYASALEEIRLIKNLDKYSKDNKDSITSINNMLIDITTISKNDNIRERYLSLESFIKDYSEIINNKNFFKFLGVVKNDLDYLSKEIAIMDKKLEDILASELDVANSLLIEYKSSYPFDDVSSVVESLQEKKEIIESNAKKNLGIGTTEASKNSSQLITVVSTGGSSAELTFWEVDSNNNWISKVKTFARLGYSGMKLSSEVYEMDGCTPTGVYTLKEAFGIYKNPGSLIPYRVLDGSEYWVDDVNSPFYNTMQYGEANGRWSSAEYLISYKRAYNYSVVIDYNRYPVVPGKSSAIFLHCDTGAPTLGCVAVDEETMIYILKLLDPNKNPQIILDFSYENIYNNY